MYNGEAEVLDVRLHELGNVVDTFVIVEAGTTHAGDVKPLYFPKQKSRFSKFASKIRHVVIREWPEAVPFEPWPQNTPAYLRENWQRDSLMLGIQDAKPDDLILVSDADEIPRCQVISQARDDMSQDTFGFRLGLYYFAFNFKNVGGPEANLAWSFAVRRHVLDKLRATELRYKIRSNLEVAPSIRTRYFENAGWHFSYLADRAGIIRKLRATTHQEFNTPEQLEKIDPHQCIQHRRDLHGRLDFVWDLVDVNDLPDRVLHNLPKFRRFVWLPGSTPARQMALVSALLTSASSRLGAIFRRN
jgi:hypothetical protein